MAGAENVLLSSPKSVQNGLYSSVSTHSDAPIAVCAIQVGIGISSALYCSVGSIDKKKWKVTWENFELYTRGSRPSMALFSSRDGYYAVEVHTQRFRRRCHYRIWKINRAERKIDWGYVNKGIHYDLGKGSKPKVAANNDSVMVIVYESGFLEISYTIGIVNTYIKKIPRTNPALINAIRGVEPDVSINKDKVAVVCRTLTGRIRFAIGDIQVEDGQQLNVTWTNDLSIPGKGIYPSIAINYNGNVLLLYQTMTLRKLCYRYGAIQNNRTNWGNEERMHHTYGEYPTVALTNYGFVAEMHTSNLGHKIFEAQGTLIGLALQPDHQGPFPNSSSDDARPRNQSGQPIMNDLDVDQSIRSERIPSHVPSRGSPEDISASCPT